MVIAAAQFCRRGEWLLAVAVAAHDVGWCVVRNDRIALIEPHIGAQR